MDIVVVAQDIAKLHRLTVVDDFEPERDHDALGRVTLRCVDGRGRWLVLSVGERRHASIFPDGYRREGELRIPGIITRGDNPVPHEVEEYLGGHRWADHWPMQGLPFRAELVARAVSAYRRMRHAFGALELPRTRMYLDWHARCIRWTRIAYHGGLLTAPEASKARWRLLVLSPSDFEIGHGKFALTHLLDVPMCGAEIGLIDLAHVRWVPRYYDLASLCWASWFHTSTEQLRDVTGTLRAMCGILDAASTPDERRQSAVMVDQFRRVLLERAIGALADLARDVEHVHRTLRAEVERRDQLVTFLQELVRRLIA